jgi:transposase
MIYLALDVHQKFSRYEAFDPAGGELVSGRVFTTRQDLLALLERWPGPRCVVLEACREAPAVCRWLRQTGAEIHLADPQALVASRPRRLAKTDKIDASLLLAKLLAGELPEAYLASPEVEQQRVLSRNRQVLRTITTTLRNMLRIIFCQAGLECRFSDLTGQAASAQVSLLLAQLPPNARLVGQQFWTLLCQAEAAVAAVDAQIAAQAQADPAARELMRRPGFGPVTAFGLLAEIGDVRRFASPRQLHAYAGAVPRVWQSGERLTVGSLPQHCNKHLRHLAVLAAQGAARSKADSRAKGVYQRVKFRQRGRPRSNSAKIAAAREMLSDAWYVLTALAEGRTPAAS